MKQLKFMLAAATAVGLATAAQADVNTYLVGTGADAKENFNDATLGAAATSLTGYSYAGATAADNESVVVANGYNGSQSLQVNTGTDPIVRDINVTDGAAIDMTAEGFKSLTIDTMVQFTVTPYGDTVTPGVDDKLMIYLKEDLSDAENPVTNLVVRAAGLILDQDGVATTEFEENGREYVIEGYEIDPTQWYRLQVKARAVAMDEEGGCWPVFQVFIGEEPLTLAGSGFDDENLGLECDADFSSEFVSLQIKDVGLFYTSEADEVKLRYVGFAGEGMVDDLLVFRTDEGQTSVDFTLALGTGVSAVTWTIDGVAQTDTLTGKVTAGQRIAITGVTYADWYGPTGTYVKDWSGVWGTDVTANITVEAKKLAEVANDGSGSVVIESTTTPAELNIMAGSFASEAAGSAELAKAVKWATSKGGASASTVGATVGALNFADEEETQAEKAYLLNVANDAGAVAAAIAAFKFPAFEAGKVPTVFVPADGYNVEPKIIGAETLEALKTSTTPATTEHKFFKAVLSK